MGPNVALESLEVVPNVDNGGSFLSIYFLVTDVWEILPLSLHPMTICHVTVFTG
jgi:hypothetical protein